MIIPVILSGGAGTRLWPLSRELYPKQFLPLSVDMTMLQDTFLRLKGIPDIADPIVVCNEEHRFLVAEQARSIDITTEKIMLEPIGRNTAPAVAVSAMAACERDPDAVLLVLPADHVIRDKARFIDAVSVALHAAIEGALVTFGIVPTRPETGYGYIKAGEVIKDNKNKVFRVDRFVEKPVLKKTEEYVASGDYYWNSGIFVFRADIYLKELEHFEPEMISACRRALDGARKDLDFLRLESQSFMSCPSNSIDYAVMEKTDSAVVVPLDAGWSDVGSWDALYDISGRDNSGNVISGDVLLEDVRDSYLRAESRLVAAVGISGHVVIETSDAVLVAPRDRAQDVKDIVERLKKIGRQERIVHRRVFRPWGSYESIAVGERFQVKHIVVNQGASLSLQRHYHRAEHWIVVKGTAKITKNDESFLLAPDQSTYIPISAIHRLENPGMIPVEIIEVQSGSYLGEDDIERFDDDYGRTGDL